MYFVYRFLDKHQNIIYVGKSKQPLEMRFRAHQHLPKDCYELTYTIEYIECETEADMSIKEIYYINKYQNNHNFFNLLDNSTIPVSVDFDDVWKPYVGPLENQFSQSVNFIKGYKKKSVEKYNKDGTINQSKSHRIKGITSFVDGLTEDEVNAIIEYLVIHINGAENANQEQIRFRNLLMFMLGVNLPHKANELLGFTYKDLFDMDDCPKSVKFELGRVHKDDVIYIPIKRNVQEILLIYAKKYNLSYKNNAEDIFFQSRKHHIITQKSWWNILNDAVNAIGVEKNIGGESLRKTYGLNIFNKSNDKLSALVFLGELWRQTREAQIIKYLNLVEKDIDLNYYLGEDFSLGNVDLSSINCLK